MRLVTVVFGDQASHYRRLCDALVVSAARNSPTTPLSVVSIAPPEQSAGATYTPIRGSRIPACRRRYAPRAAVTRLRSRPDPRRQTLAWNVAKLAAWNDAVQGGRDGEVIALLDCDTLVCQDLSVARSLAFDVAYTVREDPQLPFNGGVVLVRVGPASREIFARWRERDLELFGNPRRHYPYRIRYGGMNQASWGSLLEDGIAGEYRVLRLTCAEWNCQDSNWRRFDPLATKILHVKGRLRRACLGSSPYAEPDLVDLVDLWRQFDRAEECA